MTQNIDRRTMLQQATALFAGAAAGIGTLQTQPQKEGEAAYLFPGFKVSKSRPPAPSFMWCPEDRDRRCC
jgi:hypothetical protein